MRLFKEMFIVFLGLAAFVYLIYPSLGVFELIPDALPFVGSIDEGTASLVLISVLRYYGLDLSRLFGGRASQQHPLVPSQREAQKQQGNVNSNTQPTDAQYQRLQQEEARRNRNG
jgi:hypothetical protein